MKRSLEIILCIFILLLFMIMDPEPLVDASTYQIAFTTLLSGGNPWTMPDGFYYLPHFFCIAPLFFSPWIYLGLGIFLGIWLVSRLPQYHLLFSVMYVLSLYAGNFDPFLCVAAYGYFRGNLEKRAGFFLSMKPQFILLFFFHKKYWEIVTLIIGAGVSACLLGFLSPVTFALSFLRPSILCWIVFSKDS